MTDSDMGWMRLWEDAPAGAAPVEAVRVKTAFLTAEAGDGLIVTGATGVGPRLEVPAQIGGRSVVAIGDSAFRGSGDLRAVLLPEGLLRVGKCAFQGCVNLAELTLPRRMETIGESAFQGCSALAAVALPEGLTEIADRVFYGCASLRRVDVPGGVARIGERAFAGCTALSAVSLPEGLTEIAHLAFAACPSLGPLDVPASVTVLSASALPRGDMEAGQYYLRPQATLVRAEVKRYYEVPKGARRLAGGALAGNESLLGVDFGDALEAVGPFAMAGCACLKRVDLPDAVREVGRAAFSGCIRMTEARLSPAMRAIAPETFLGCHALERVALFGGIEDVGERAFEDCRALKALALPEGVRRVGQRAFYRCVGLERLELPGSLEALGVGALSGCNSLRVLVLRGALTEAVRPALEDARRAVIVAPNLPPEAFTGLWRKRVCLGYALAVSEGIPYAPRAARACREWMRAHGSAFVAEALRDKGLMHLLAECDCLSLGDVQTLLERADGPDRDEYYVTLLEYRNRRFGGETDGPMTLW